LTLQTRQSGNLPFNFGGMTKRSMPPCFKAPCSLWRVFADFAKTLALPWFNLPTRDRFILAGFIWANVVGAMGTGLYAPSWCKVA